MGASKPTFSHKQIGRNLSSDLCGSMIELWRQKSSENLIESSSSYLSPVAQRPPVQVDDGERGTSILDRLHRLDERLVLAVGALLRHQAEHSQSVLVHLDELSVLEYFHCFGLDVAQVVAHVQRRRPDAPDGHLSARLLGREAEVADHQLIRIEPVTWTC